MPRTSFASAGSADAIITNLLTDEDVNPAELRAAAMAARFTPIGGHGYARTVELRINAALAFAAELEERDDYDRGLEAGKIAERRERLSDHRAEDRTVAAIMLDAIRELEPELAERIARFEAGVA